MQFMLANRKHEIFARELAAGEALEASYLAAGYKPGRSARFNASRLRNRSQVKKRIEELLTQFADQAALRIEYLQHQLLPLVQINAQDLFENGKLKSITDLPREAAAAVKSVKFNKKTGEIAEVILADKIAAATLLLRSIGAIAETTVNNSVNLSMAERLDAAVKRMNGRQMVDITPATRPAPPPVAPLPAPARRSGNSVEF